MTLERRFACSSLSPAPPGIAGIPKCAGRGLEALECHALSVDRLHGDGTSAPVLDSGHGKAGYAYV